MEDIMAQHITDLTEEETQLVVEALYELRKVKQEALDTLKAEGLKPGGRQFEPRDFAIPQIDALIRRYEA
jgi:hypothetical protein